MPGQWGADGRQMDLFEPDPRMEDLVNSLKTVLLKEEAIGFFQETRAERFTVTPEPLEESVPPQPYPAPAGDLFGGRDEKYTLLHDGDAQNGGNVRLSLSVPWSRGKTGRAGILPDAVYLGTDVDYFSIAEGLQSGNADYRTLPSELNRLGSDWLETPTGYIHFEWRLGK